MTLVTFLPTENYTKDICRSLVTTRYWPMCNFYHPHRIEIKSKLVDRYLIVLVPHL